MLRSVLIMALLGSLFYLLTHLQPASELAQPDKVATSRTEKPAADAHAEEPGGFNPAVPTPLPDVNQGYVFSEQRKYEKDASAGALKAAPAVPGPDLLASVLYSGSVIVGDLRRALVTYQDQSSEAAPRRPLPGRNQAPVNQGATRNKQLNKGDRFLGYVVAAVEPDRIVFEMADKKVEKFLYDQSKKRLAPPESRSQEPAAPGAGGVPLQAMAPPEVLAALMALPQSRRPVIGAARGSVPSAGAAAAGENGAVVQDSTGANRLVRRSQRILGIDPSIQVPVTPVPGRPIPNN